MKKSKKKKGSALVVTVMLCSVFAAAIVTVGAMAIRQINIIRAYDNGLVAFYVAESGVEEGLLRYRFDKNVQVPYNIEVKESDPLKRTPTKSFRNFLNWQKLGYANSRDGDSGDGNGVLTGYSKNDTNQVYDLAVYYKQKYFGKDLNSDGKIDQNDLQDTKYKTYTDFRILKDESKAFSIPQDQGKLTLYWSWDKACSSGNQHALEVKLRVAEADAVSGKDTYTALFADPSCAITNASNADTAPGSPKTLFISDVKGRMNITSKTVIEMIIHPVSKIADDNIVFGYMQNNGLNFVAGPTTTIRSIGYFRGTTREVVAEIDRQNGTILDLFNYVLYKGGS